MILVTGATGNVGAEVTAVLAEAGNEVRALVRAGKENAVPAGATPAIGDLNQPESLAPALDGVCGVFLLPGYQDMPGVLTTVLDRDLRFEGQPDDEARVELIATMPTEYVDAFFSFYVDGTLDESTVHPTVQELTGQPPRTFRQWAVAHADAFQ